MAKKRNSLREVLVNEFLKKENIKKRDVIHYKDVLNWLERNHPGEYESSTVYNYLTKLSTNCRGRLNWKITKGDDDIFVKLSSGKYRLYNKNKDKSPIYTKEDANRELLTPTADPEELDSKVAELRRKKKEKPLGNPRPQKSKTPSTSYYRDPHVKAWILQEAKGVCESCDSDAPFKDKFGYPFLEVHHVHPFAENGPDTIYNAVALCPNCHRKYHFPRDAKSIRKKLAKTLKEKRKGEQSN